MDMLYKKLFPIIVIFYINLKQYINNKFSNIIYSIDYRLNEEMRRCGRFGLGLALDMLPISTCASHEAPNLYETSSVETNSEEKHVTVEAPPPGGAECARLMTDLVLELIDNKAL